MKTVQPRRNQTLQAPNAHSLNYRYQEKKFYSIKRWLNWQQIFFQFSLECLPWRYKTKLSRKIVPRASSSPEKRLSSVSGHDGGAGREWGRWTDEFHMGIYKSRTCYILSAKFYRLKNRSCKPKSYLKEEQIMIWIAVPNVRTLVWNK